MAKWIYGQFNDGARLNDSEARHEAAKILAACDRNSDGTVSQEEFKEWFDKASKLVVLYKSFAADGITLRMGSSESLVLPVSTICLAVISLASFIVMIAAARACDLREPTYFIKPAYNSTQSKDDTCTDVEGWAVAAGVISFVLSTGLLAVEYFVARPTCQGQVTGWPIPVFLVLWWFAAVGSSTFYAPFKMTGNGYFGVWTALLASIYYVMDRVPRARDAFKAADGFLKSHEQRYAVTISLCSLVQVICVAVECDELKDAGKDCDDEYGLAFVISILCLVLSLLYIACIHHVLEKASETMQRRLRLALAGCFVICSVIGVGVFTFDKPFTVTGNGFFATWTCGLASLLFWFECNGLCHIPAHAKGEQLQEEGEELPAPALFIDQIPGEAAKA